MTFDMQPSTDEIDALRRKRATTKRDTSNKLAALKASVKETERKQVAVIDRRIRRAESRLRAQQRRQEKQRLIQLGLFVEARAKSDPIFKAFIDSLLDVRLTRPSDRDLFGLPSHTRFSLLRSRLRLHFHEFRYLHSCYRETHTCIQACILTARSVLRQLRI